MRNGEIATLAGYKDLAGLWHDANSNERALARFYGGRQLFAVIHGLNEHELLNLDTMIMGRNYF